MLDWAPLEVVLPYLKTLWRGMGRGGLRVGSMGKFPGPHLSRITHNK